MNERSRNISVVMEMDYGPGGQCSISGKGNKFFSTAQCPEQLCGLPPLLSHGHFFHRCGGGVKLITHTHLLPRSRMMELYLHSFLCLHGTVTLYLNMYAKNTSSPRGTYGMLRNDTLWCLMSSVWQFMQYIWIALSLKLHVDTYNERYFR
jgi:hypothetical protein